MASLVTTTVTGDITIYQAGSTKRVYVKNTDASYIGSFFADANAVKITAEGNYPLLLHTPGTLTLNSGGSAALTLDGSQAATFAGALSGTTAAFSGEIDAQYGLDFVKSQTIKGRLGYGAGFVYVGTVSANGILKLYSGNSVNALEFAADQLATFSGNVNVEGTGILHINSPTSVNFYLDRSAANKHSSAVFQTAGVSKWSLGLPDSDVSGVDGTEFYLGQTTNGTSPALLINTSNNATFSGALTVGGSISADTDDSYNLGSDSYRFKNLYLRSDCIIGADATVGGSLDVTGGLVVDGASTLGDGSDTTHVKGSLVVDTNIYGPSLGAVAVAAGLNVTGAGSFTGALTIGAYTLPNTDGTAGYHLQTNGSGAVTWQPGGAGTVTSVTAGTGMTQTGTSTVNPTLNVIGGTGITANANDIAITNTAVTAGSYTYAAITVDAQGRLTAASSGTAPGGGTVTGSGTDNYIPRWNGTTALHNSIIYDSGASVGISSVAFTSPAGTLHTQAVGANITYFDAYSTTNGTGSLMVFRKSDSDTAGTKTQTDSGDSLGTFSFYGVNSGSGWGLGAGINISQEGVSGTSYVPAHIAFSTCTASAYAEKMRITSAGFVGIGTASPDCTLHIEKLTGGTDVRISAGNYGTNYGGLSLDSVSFGISSGNSVRALGFLHTNQNATFSGSVTVEGDDTDVENLYVNQDASFNGSIFQPVQIVNNFSGYNGAAGWNTFWQEQNGWSNSGSAYTFWIKLGTVTRTAANAYSDFVAYVDIYGDDDVQNGLDQFYIRIGTSPNYSSIAFVGRNGSFSANRLSKVKVIRTSTNANPTTGTVTWDIWMKLSMGWLNSFLLKWNYGYNSTSFSMAFTRNQSEVTSEPSGEDNKTEDDFTNTTFFAGKAKVGIGTDAPYGGLHVNASNYGESPTINKALLVSDSADVTKYLILTYHASVDVGIIQGLDDSLAWKNVAINPNGGNVGIGTTSPAALLHVYRGTYSNVHKSLILTNSSSTPFAGTTYDSVVINQDDVPCIRMRETGTNVELTFAVGNEYSNSATIGTTGMLKFATNRSVGQTGYLDQNTRMVILADGNVGIGTTTPKQKLHIFQTEGGVGVKHATIRLGGYLDKGAEIAAYRTASNSNNMGLKFSANNVTNGIVDVMTLDDLGNVGVGTTEPVARLHVGSAIISSDVAVRIETDNASTYTPALQFAWGGDVVAEADFQYDTRATTGFKIGTTAATHPMSFVISDVPKMYIDGGGLVGIGTTTPGANLEVYSTTANSNGIAYIRQAVATNNPTLLVEQTVQGGNQNVNQGLVVKAVGTGDGTGNTLHVYQRDGSTTGLVVKGSGKVGIGTVAPAATLDVHGSMVRISSDGGAYRRLMFFDSLATPSKNNFQVAVQEINNALHIGPSTAVGGTTFSGSTGLAMLANGSVGIGDASPTYKLDVNGTLRATGAVTFDSSLGVTGTATFSNPAYFNSTGTGIKGAYWSSTSTAVGSLYGNRIENMYTPNYLEKQLAYMVPTKFEVSNSSGSSFSDVTVDNIVAGIFNEGWYPSNQYTWAQSSNKKIRFSFTQFGYKFVTCMAMRATTASNTVTMMVEKSSSADFSSGVVTVFTSTGMNGWPGFWQIVQQWHNSGNSAAMRITLESNQANSNNISLNNIDCIGGYGFGSGGRILTGYSKTTGREGILHGKIGINASPGGYYLYVNGTSLFKDGVEMDDTLELDGNFTWSGYQYFTHSTARIIADTADGSDTKNLFIGGGGEAGQGRGAYVGMYGNDHALTPGRLELLSGNDGSVAIYSGGTERLTIANGGAINLAGALTVAADAVFQNSTHTVVSIKAQASGNKYAMLYMTSNGTQDNYIRADVGDLVIDGSHSSVNVTKALAVTGALTGTSATFHTLKVSNTSGTQTMHYPGAGAGAGLPIYWSSNNTGSELTLGAVAVVNQDASTRRGKLYLQTAHDAAPSVRVTIDSLGNVGINDLSPTYRLDVNGTGRFTGALTGATAAFSGEVDLTVGLDWYDPTSSVYGRLGYGSDFVYVGAKGATGILKLESGGNVACTFAANHDATFTGALTGTSATFSGNCLAPGWQVSSSGSEVGSIYWANSGMSIRAGNSGAAQFLLTTATATFSGALTVSGNIKFAAATAGNSTNPALTSSTNTAGVYFVSSGVGFGSGSTTKKLFLASTGNVGIGTESPGYRLDVRGNTWVQGSLETSGQLKAGTSLAIGSSGSGGYTLPAADGTANYVLKTNGSGTVSWGQLLEDSLTNSIVSEAKLKVSNVPTNGYVLTARSGNAGGMTWEAASGGGGTVTSVATTGAITGGTITTTGTIAHSTSAGYKHVPTGGSSKQYLKYSSSGTAVWSTVAWEDLPDISTLTTLP